MPSALVRHLERSASPFYNDTPASASLAAAPPRPSPSSVRRSDSKNSTNSTDSSSSSSSSSSSQSKRQSSDRDPLSRSASSPSQTSKPRPPRSILKKSRRSTSSTFAIDEKERFLNSELDSSSPFAADKDTAPAMVLSRNRRRSWLSRLLSPSSASSLSTSSTSASSSSSTSGRSRGWRGRSLRYIGRHVFSRRTLTAVLCVSAVFWNWQMYTFGQAWELDWKRGGAAGGSVEASSSSGGGLGNSEGESGSGYTLWALPFAFRIYSLVGIACAGIGLAGLVKERSQWLRMFVVQQAIDLFFGIFQPLAATLLLYHPAVQAFICSLLASPHGKTVPASLTPQPSPLASATTDGAVAAVTAAVTAAATGSSAANGTAASAGASSMATTSTMLLNDLQTQFGDSSSQCASHLISKVVPIALGVLLIVSAIRIWLWIQLCRYYRQLRFNQRSMLINGTIVPMDYAEFYGYGGRHGGEVERMPIMRLLSPAPGVEGNSKNASDEEGEERKVLGVRFAN